MKRPIRGIALGAAVISTALVTAGCSGSRFGSSAYNTLPPEQAQPVASSSVQSQALPPLAGPDGAVTTSEPTAAGEPAAFDPTVPQTGDPALIGQPGELASADGSFVSLDDVGSLPSSSGRNLSGDLTVAKLLGSWTLIAGGQQCRLNLTQTTKSGTDRYRASTPGCTIAALSGVASWQLAGKQVQLYDDKGAIVGSLLLSGDRFIGTLAGGIAVSMVG